MTEFKDETVTIPKSVLRDLLSRLDKIQKILSGRAKEGNYRMDWY